MDNCLELSVHQLVDFLLRSGDIDSRVFNSSSMQEGSRLHAAYQSKQINKDKSLILGIRPFNIEISNIIISFLFYFDINR